MDYVTAHALFEYRDGALFRRAAPPRSKVLAGARVGTVNGCGYEIFSYKKKQYRAHRIIFLLHHGYAPEYVDHVNGNRLDNRVENLRAADPVTNQYNTKKHVDNTSRHKNVWVDPRTGHFVVKVAVSRKNTYVGTYKTLPDAVAAAKQARIAAHGAFANHGD
jgi:hypothetical protein